MVPLIFVLVLSWLIIAGLLWTLFLTTRRHGRALAEIEALRRTRPSTIQRDGLPAGSNAPAFRLPDLQGNQVSLTDFAGRRILLVFSDPACGPCQTLAPELQKIHARHQANGLSVLMISRGDPAANREKAADLRLTFPIVLQRRWEVSKDYAMFATPIGYLVDEKGVLASGVAIGGDAILALAG